MSVRCVNVLNMQNRSCTTLILTKPLALNVAIGAIGIFYNISKWIIVDLVSVTIYSITLLNPFFNHSIERIINKTARE